MYIGTKILIERGLNYVKLGEEYKVIEQCTRHGLEVTRSFDTVVTACAYIENLYLKHNLNNSFYGGLKYRIIAFGLHWSVKN